MSTQDEIKVWFEGRSDNIPPFYRFYKLALVLANEMTPNDKTAFVKSYFEQKEEMDRVAKTVPFVDKPFEFYEGNLQVTALADVTLWNDQPNPTLEFMLKINDNEEDNGYVHLEWTEGGYKIMSAQTCVTHFKEMVKVLRDYLERNMV